MISYMKRQRWTLITFLLLLSSVFLYGVQVGSSSVLASELMVFHDGLTILALVLFLAAGVLSIDFIEYFRERHVVSVRTRTSLKPYLARLILRRAGTAFIVTAMVVVIWFIATLILPSALGWDTNDGRYYPETGLSAVETDVQSTYLGFLIELSPALYAVVLAVLIGFWAAVATSLCCMCAVLVPWPLLGLLIPFVATQVDNVVLGLLRLEAFRSMNLIAPWSLSKIQLWELAPAAALYVGAPLLLWGYLLRRRFDVGNLL